MKIRKSTMLVFSSLAAITIINSSCSHSRGEGVDSEPAEVVYQASLVKKEQVASQLVLPGELEGFYETSILAKVNGYVKQIKADIGDRVQQGKVLAELEAPELMSQLDGAYSEMQVKEATYLNTKGKYTRLQKTNKTPGAVSPYDMDLAITTVKADSLSFVAAISAFQAIKNLADYLTIRAPFDGIITERAVAPGSFVGPNDKNLMPILKLKSESRLRLHVAVPEKNIAEVNVGDKVQFTVKSFPDNAFEGKITRLAKNLNTQTRSEIVEIEIDNRGGQLLPGMYANVNIPLKRQKLTMVVPQSAVVINMERSFVIKVLHGSKPVWVDVQKGEQQGDRAEVFGNLVQGDTILTTASDEIKEAAAIKIVMEN